MQRRSDPTARANPGGEILVDGIFWRLQLFIKRHGGRHWIAPRHCYEQDDFEASDITLVEDSVIFEISAGNFVS